MTSTLELSVIGNSTISALLDKDARIVWACFPRFDGDPTFCALLNNGGEDETGSFNITLFDQVRSEQQYRRNSAIVVTTLFDDNGSAVEITDFAPRFKQFGRVFRPTMLVRISVRSMVRPGFAFVCGQHSITGHSARRDARLKPYPLCYA